MGAARKNAHSRDQLIPTQPASDQTPALEASVDEVVRYLRQQDDVVVSAENGEFLVNARFKLPLAELVARANRMRVRQRKPEFQVSTVPSTTAEKVASPNGHPMFWSHNAAPPVSPEPH
jgi:cytidylate kinase